jgi:hypothetical protein
MEPFEPAGLAPANDDPLLLRLREISRRRFRPK